MEKKQKETTDKVRCHDCKNAVLYQWDSNPIVAFCNKNRTRDVAMTVRKCEHYKENPLKPEVNKLTHFK